MSHDEGWDPWGMSTAMALEGHICWLAIFRNWRNMNPLLRMIPCPCNPKGQEDLNQTTVSPCTTPSQVHLLAARDMPGILINRHGYIPCLTANHTVDQGGHLPRKHFKLCILKCKALPTAQGKAGARHKKFRGRLSWSQLRIIILQPFKWDIATHTTSWLSMPVLRRWSLRWHIESLHQTSHISSPLTMARVGSLPKCLQAQTNLVSRDNNRQSAPSTPLDPLSPNTILQHFSYIRRAKCTRSSYTPLRSLTQNTFNNHLRTSYERKLRHFMKVPLLAVFRIMILAPYW